METQADALQLDHSQMVRKLKKDDSLIRASLVPGDCDLLHMAIGIASESGELLDAVKKAIIYRKPVDINNVVEELGDLEFFLEGVRQNLNITRSETLEANLIKLSTGPNARYKSGYSDAAAIARADKNLRPETQD